MNRSGKAAASLPPGVTERDVLIEQLRQVYAMLNQSNLWTLAASFILAWYLRDSGIAIFLWLGVQIALKISELLELKWFISDSDIVASPERIQLRLCITQSIHALGWTSLPWLTYSTANASQLILVVATLAGVCGGAVITYGSTFRIFSCYVAVYLLMMTGLQFTPAHDTALGNLTFIAMIFCAGMWSNAYVNAQAQRRSILLRFENVSLNNKLAAEAAELEKARQRAEAANLSKSRFLASASHDLRQPIHALSMLFGAMENEAGSEKLRGLVRQGKSAQLATSELLDALLDFSRADAGTIVAKPRPFALQAMIDQLSSEMAVVAREKGLRFRLRETSLVVASDPGLTLIILRNLISNAIRYTAHGGVLVAARRRGRRAVIEVWDSGIGIPPESQAEIFEEFLQLGNPERDRQNGLGLGLAIAKRIAKLLGTRIELRSRPGRGSVFRFALPLAASDSLVQPAPPVHAARPADMPGRQFPARHVLVVDDDAAIRIATEILFSGWGVSCASAETIAGALDCAARAAPDLLICDYRLRGGETGAEAIRLLREALGRAVPALLVTGDTQLASDSFEIPSRCRMIHKPMRSEDLYALAVETVSEAAVQQL